MDTNQIIFTIVTVLLLLIIYYLALLPKKRQAKEIKKMQEELKKGDRVITYSGLSGKIEEILEDRVIINVNPDNIKLSIEKWAIAGIDDRKIEG